MEQDSLIVEHGDPGGPVVILLDPVGATTGQHSETWALLAHYARLVRFSGFVQEDPLVEARILLERESRLSSEVYLVTCAEGEHIAFLVAGHQPDAVRGVFLVRPRTAGLGEPGVAPRTSRALLDFLAAHGVLVRSVVPRDGGARPTLGRPEAVEAVTDELVALGVGAGRQRVHS